MADYTEDESTAIICTEEKFNNHRWHVACSNRWRDLLVQWSVEDLILPNSLASSLMYKTWVNF